ncbi:MAG TPA: pantoate--beta-alanine ligase [Candidatus Cloacimonas sp.]|jgi:pantoate--beta-alanine ligase|nr:pantoate--beta-alanine ligase [Candidatus Cloacimonas sp.]HNS83830.1 pantoate--beta-alanine ligase [Candidatus Cloacimonas sp.]HPH93950.1 pantoate--beta-alanine ligase [Candidatus Cloacimonas sp.]HQC31780.1 pantoate--beta-alanine ligase [Candidatus Cloacimonas sp.]HQO46809.1 pantoate--beta-alanine ligase [Candidatus Cloacimonas sp.]
MQIIDSIKAMQEIGNNWDAGKRIGFVPTMGYFHQGHLSLVAEANKQSEITVVSIFVNPSQFGPNEDFDSYPRDMQRDLELLSNYKVDYVFSPSSEQMYPQDYRTWVEVEGISSILCGASRPGHFRGVATVILKLINILKPNLMFMGEKDFQQVTVLKKMLKDLNCITQIVPCHIIREDDGLAMSSRNIYLNPEQRKQALCLFKAIQQAQTQYKQGIRETIFLQKEAADLVKKFGGIVDYISFVEPNTLQEVAIADDNTRIMLAVFIGKTRLIDNAPLKG